MSSAHAHLLCSLSPGDSLSPRGGCGLPLSEREADLEGGHRVGVVVEAAERVQVVVALVEDVENTA